MDIREFAKTHRRKIIVAAVALFVGAMVGTCATADAAPFLVCDPQAGVEKYQLHFVGSVDPPVEITAQADGSFKYDLVNWPAGDISGELRAGKTVVLDGQDTGVFMWSDPSPFVLNAGKPAGPVGLGIVGK